MERIQERASFGRRFRWIWWTAGALLVLLGALAVAGFVVARRTEPYLRARIVEGLSDHFHARVELDAFHVSLGNGLRGEWGVWAQGRGLRIWPPAAVAGVQVPNPPPPGQPLISLGSFGFHVPLNYKPDKPIYIGDIRLEGLRVALPPKSHFLHMTPGPENAAGQSSSATGSLPIHFQLGAVECKDTTLILETSKPGKLPLVVNIARFKLTDISPNNAMRYEAQLTNPKPVGIVHTRGVFGPWQVSDPGESPISGDYTFDHADLGGFKGISGILSSTGNYTGTLRDLDVEGQTDTPDFSLTHFGNKMDLETHFHAVVDATNGDTRLDPVNAVLGKSHITARGQVIRAYKHNVDGSLQGVGHDIDLAIKIDGGHIEDFLHLASSSDTPLLTGEVTINSTLHIPPGKEPVHERMGLKGHFLLEQAQFTSDKVQSKIEELSLRGQGRPHEAKSPDHESVQSSMESDFEIVKGVVELPNLAFNVPGADIELKGAYKLEGGELGFIGVAKMQATISKMVGGWKGFLLKPADHFFKKDGAGTEVPIHISGTYKNPEFGVDVKGMPHTRPQRPDEQPPASPQARLAAPGGH